MRMTESHTQNKVRHTTGQCICIGTAIAFSIGIPIGAALDNMVLGIGLWLSFTPAFFMAIKNNNK
jgi:hypothetical protein